MVDTWKFISHVSVYSPHGTLICSDCVPICTNECDAYFYPIWKMVQRLKGVYDCSLFKFKVKVSTLSKSRPNSFSVTCIRTYSYSDVKFTFDLYD